MVSIEGQVTIARPPEAVFDFVADERNEPRFNPQMLRVEQVSAGPIGLGTRFRAEVESRGRPVEMVIEFTDFERPGRLSSSTRMSAMDIRGTLTFDPVPEGTCMRWRWELAPRGLVRLLTPLLARMGRRQEEAIWAGLKRCLEGQKSPSPGRPGSESETAEDRSERNPARRSLKEETPTNRGPTSRGGPPGAGPVASGTCAPPRRSAGR